MIDRGRKIEIPGKTLTVNTKLHNISYVVDVINKIKVVNWKKLTIKEVR